MSCTCTLCMHDIHVFETHQTRQGNRRHQLNFSSFQRVAPGGIQTHVTVLSRPVLLPLRYRGSSSVYMHTYMYMYRSSFNSTWYSLARSNSTRKTLPTLPVISTYSIHHLKIVHELMHSNTHCQHCTAVVQYTWLCGDHRYKWSPVLRIHAYNVQFPVPWKYIYMYMQVISHAQM